MDAATVAFESYWRDKEGKAAQLTLHFPFSSTREEALTEGLAIVSVAQQLSDAVLAGYRLVWESKIDNPGEAPVEADVTSFLGLFYSNGDETSVEALWIPSPKLDLFESTGEYAGIRLNQASTGATAFAVYALEGSLRTKEGEAWPPTLVVGGLRL